MNTLSIDTIVIVSNKCLIIGEQNMIITMVTSNVKKMIINCSPVFWPTDWPTKRPSEVRDLRKCDPDHDYPVETIGIIGPRENSGWDGRIEEPCWGCSSEGYNRRHFIQRSFGSDIYGASVRDSFIFKAAGRIIEVLLENLIAPLHYLHCTQRLLALHTHIWTRSVPCARHWFKLSYIKPSSQHSVLSLLAWWQLSYLYILIHSLTSMYGIPMSLSNFLQSALCSGVTLTYNKMV